MTQEKEIQRYIKSGEYNALHLSWPGDNIMERCQIAEHTLKKNLLEVVRKQANDKSPPSLPEDFDVSQFTISKIQPMVKGFFTPKERDSVLGLFRDSLVFITADNIDQVINNTSWLNTAWDIANLYLGSLDVPGLDGNKVGIVGLSEGQTFFVSMDYFEDEDPFADYVIHEAAHVFHNWKRKLAGLPQNPNREWLLPIDIRKRELFAYTCEAYSRILEQTKISADRRRLHADYVSNWIPSADNLDQNELKDVLFEAVTARSGWKRILQRCKHD